MQIDHRYNFALMALALAAPSALPAQSGTLVVLNKGGASAFLIDVASGMTMARLETGEGPHEVAVSGDGNWAVAANYGAQVGGNTLTVIDVPGKRVANLIDLGEYNRPHGITFLPGDTSVVVTAEADQAVVVVGIPGGEILAVLPTDGDGSHMLAVPRDARNIYTGNMRDDNVSKIDVASGKTISMWNVPEVPEAIGVTPDGREVWVGSNRHGTVTALDATNGQRKGQITGFTFPYRILFTPDSRMAIIPDLRQNRVSFYDRESLGELHTLELPGTGPEGVILSPDASILYLSLSQQDQVVAIDLETFEVVRHYETGRGPDGIGYSRVELD